MLGEPSDVDGECNARLFIADNYGDGSATIRCHLSSGHEGVHREEFERQGSPVTITWAVDERKRCDHGCGQWDHAHEDHIVLATACIDGSHGGARIQNGLGSSGRNSPGNYEIRIAGVLPPGAFATAEVDPGCGALITTVVVGDVVHVQACAPDGCAMDADFRVAIVGPLVCPRNAGDHEYADCAWCHPGETAQTCGHCGKVYYYEAGHLRHCAQKPFACTICGESGVGNHDWPMGCPKKRVKAAERDINDEFGESLRRGYDPDDSVPQGALDYARTLDENFRFAEEAAMAQTAIWLADLLAHTDTLQDELANLAGIAEAQISQILCGDSNPTVRTVARIACALRHRVTLAFQPQNAQQEANRDEISRDATRGANQDEEANPNTGFLTNAELQRLQADTSSKNVLLTRALNELNELRARRAHEMQSKEQT